ncbi:MAG: haloacid dehalogenase-like hydrolase [Candidatus Poribacteria bacterium]|nr:haloacid dehalogenase-like hydrolase [Candidatus Poribacteria bacterium]MDE0506567.1 haloacid dehalogenase-like hydrolase [Candidatus Poribacteria bacterium]
MPIYRVDKLISDFDETISQKDTIQTIVGIAMQNRTANEPPTVEEWKQMAGWYTSRYSRRCNKWLSVPRDRSQETFTDFLSDIESLDVDSIGRVMKKNFLAGLRQDQLRKAGSQVQTREGVKECLSEMRSAGVVVEILSANWSQTFVKEAVLGFCDSVVANRLLFDKRGYSTGELKLRVVSAHDKLRHFKFRRSKTGLTGFVGDSISDLRAILEADVGILVGDNEICLKTIDHYKIPIKRVSQGVNFQEARSMNKQILHADSWETINRLLKQK